MFSADDESYAIAAITVATLAPFLPNFLNSSNPQGHMPLATTDEGDWIQAREMWDRIMKDVDTEPRMRNVVLMIPSRTDEATWQTLLVKALGACMEENLALKQDIVNFLNGKHSIQEVMAKNNSQIEDVTQDIEGTGRQAVQANNGSVIKSVRQTIRK